MLLLCGAGVASAVPGGIAALYGRGRTLEREQELEAAANVYARVGEAELPERVRRDVRTRRAVLGARAGRCAEVRDALAELAGAVGGHRGAVLEAMAAECALAAGELAAAEPLLRAVIDRDAKYVDTFAAWMGLAQVLAARGDRDGARRELHELLATRPEHPDADRARAQLEELGGAFEPTTDQRMDRAERLMDFGRYDDALKELEGLTPRGREARRRWLHLRGTALYRTRHNYAEASDVLAQAAKLGGPHRVLDAFRSARADSRAGEVAAAVAAYGRVVRQYPHHRLAARAEYLAAWLEMRRGRTRGRIRMRRFLTGPRAALVPSLERGARWHLAFSDFERGRHRRAAEGFERYSASGSGALVRARGLYWRGRALQQAGQRQTAIDAYRKAYQIEALHYYGVLARHRLVQLDAAPEVPPLPDAARPLPEIPLPAAARFYRDAGFMDDARSALDAERDRITEAASEGRELQALVDAFLRVRGHSRAYRLVAIREREALDRFPTSETRWAWDASHPRPWREAVVAAARPHAVPEPLVYGVMRQESAFDHEAVSYAGAVGLMQLMPFTARRLSPEADRVRLFDPLFNVRLGAQLLGELLVTFGGSEPLAVAAYNAGGHRVRAWLEGPHGGELDRFVERIPIRQTRNYVRRVMSHYVRYQYLGGEADPGFSLELP